MGEKGRSGGGADEEAGIGGAGHEVLLCPPKCFR
jgi:hypothetical protein